MIFYKAGLLDGEILCKLQLVQHILYINKYIFTQKKNPQVLQMIIFFSWQMWTNF